MEEKPSPSHQLFRPKDIFPIERGGGAGTIPMASRKNGSSSLMNGITLLDPRAEIPLHSHNCDEAVIVLEGDA